MMAGARIRIEIDDAQARAALDRLAKAGADLAPAMKNIGETLIDSTRQRFFDHEAPDGTPWAPLTETTRRRKTRNVSLILTEEGTLRGGIAYQAGADSVLVGSPDVRAGTHQFGAAKGAFGTMANGAPTRTRARAESGPLTGASALTSGPDPRPRARRGRGTPRRRDGGRGASVRVEPGSGRSPRVPPDTPLFGEFGELASPGPGPIPASGAWLSRRYDARRTLPSRAEAGGDQREPRALFVSS